MFYLKEIYHSIGTGCEEEEFLPVPYATKEEAMEEAFQRAMDAADFLQEDCDEGVSFSAIETPNGANVEYYYMESDMDTTGNTRLVFEYFVISEEEGI